MKTSKEKLNDIRVKGLFTASLPFDKFVEDLCRRYARIFKEVLPVNDYDYIVAKLEEKGLMDNEDHPKTVDANC